MGSFADPPLLVHDGAVRTDSITALVTASRHDVKERLTRLRSWLGGLPMCGISAYLISVTLFGVAPCPDLDRVPLRFTP